MKTTLFQTLVDSLARRVPPGVELDLPLELDHEQLCAELFHPELRHSPNGVQPAEALGPGRFERAGPLHGKKLR